MIWFISGLVLYCSGVALLLLSLYGKKATSAGGIAALALGGVAHLVFLKSEFHICPLNTPSGFLTLFGVLLAWAIVVTYFFEKSRPLTSYGAAVLLLMSMIGSFQIGKTPLPSESYVVPIHVFALMCGTILLVIAMSASLAGIASLRRIKEGGVAGSPPTSLETLDRIALYTIMLGLAFFSVGIGIGIFDMSRRGKNMLDAVVVISMLSWLSYLISAIIRLRAGFIVKRMLYACVFGTIFLVITVILFAFAGDQFHKL